MPVEIKEMVVKAFVPAQKQELGDEKGHARPLQSGGGDHDRLVEECVAAVMKIMEKRDRR